jgi:type I restriction enzyme S subunit
VTRDNLTNYHIIEFDDFVYNPRISVAAPVGPISRNKVGLGIMSPLYTIFRFKEGNIDFFEQYFRTNCWHQYLKDKANFGARFDRMNISSEDFMNLPIPFPPLAEQQCIAACLSAANEMMASTNGKLEQLKTYKKGLMQKLFPAKGKKLPELRFKEFEKEGEWVEKRLGEVAEVFQGYGFPEKLQGKTKGKFPFIKVSDISSATNKGCRFISNAVNYIDEEDLDVLKARPFPDGTIVFAKIGEAIRLNRRAILKQESLIDNNVAGVKAKLDLSDEEFLYYIMLMIDLVKYAGGVVPAVKKTSIEEIEVLLPPDRDLHEQRKITDCFNSIDEMINQYTNKIASLELYKKGLMQQMFPTSK